MPTIWIVILWTEMYGKEEIPTYISQYFLTEDAAREYGENACMEVGCYHKFDFIPFYPPGK